MCGAESETFFTLIRDPGHWEFEIFLILMVDGLLLGFLLPILKKRWTKQ